MNEIEEEEEQEEEARTRARRVSFVECSKGNREQEAHVRWQEIDPRSVNDGGTNSTDAIEPTCTLAALDVGDAAGGTIVTLSLRIRGFQVRFGRAGLHREVEAVVDERRWASRGSTDRRPQAWIQRHPFRRDALLDVRPLAALRATSPLGASPTAASN
jgi:hypothetical protein